MTYIDPEIVVDEATTAEALLAAIADQIPGWEPSEGHVETALAEAMAVVSSTVAILLRDEARDAFSGFGEAVLGIPRRTAEVAEATATWTAADDVGYTVPDGAQVVMDAPGGLRVGFAAVGESIIPAGQTSVAGVRMVALEPGAQANGLSGLAAAVDPLPGIEAATFTAESSGGADDEPMPVYADRLADRARRLRTVAITVDDFAALALDHPSAARSLAVNLLDVATAWTLAAVPSAGGHVSVFPIDAAGEPLSAVEAAEVEALLTGDDRPLNVTVHVAAPTYTVINVAITVRTEPEVDQSAARDAVEAAIATYLDPAGWALDSAAPGRWREPASTGERTVRHFDVAHVADQVPGIAGVADCTLNSATAVTLTGWAPLPRAGMIAVEFEA